MSTPVLLENYVAGQWVAGRGEGTALTDPVTGDTLARVSSDGLDLDAAFTFARDTAGPALRALSFAERAQRLSQIVTTLQANRDDYYAIATANSGTVATDSAVDIDGAIYTLSTYAKLGAALGDAHTLLDGAATPLAKDGSFAVRHVLRPTPGVALFINAFNFPSWGLWEKAAAALLAGVPVIVKPATSTAWLTQRMVADVVAANVLPAGSLSVICGSAAGLLDRIGPFDVVSFTGSAATAATLRAHPAFTERSARINVEADSLNSALLLPDAAPGTAAFDQFVREVAREMTVKSGQKCTAIRRALVPVEHFDAAAAAIAERLAKTVVGNPRNDTVRMGSLVNLSQKRAVLEGIADLQAEAETLYDGNRDATFVDTAAESACVAPVLLGLRNGASGQRVHDTEVFGPVATLVGYRDIDEAIALAKRGQGSLVVSLFSNDALAMHAPAVALADAHGRVHAVDPSVAKTQTGHGNVMPQSLHGGPGRAGGGEELGGLRALRFYHVRSAIQGPAALVESLTADAVELPK
ncbi:3,4-dehydroadipyl-CoA semialdehyde dehydrogenase [Pandoraea norimbergensis]|uniref:Aldehyde dehydrogenase n=1 Tax=Pandoraea norimbergensis TaxID=93219 RepID=A0ABN4JIY2_9BURK|nr:3,4-dehydroadipyl-CoA semialdehyde dehydrogenase [Pandoraea norimbergensis]ALS60856.1 phenylacetic acid degradation bifunctional protein PaaZ [Pandoraea norimbergensis]